jgi:folylpolyglutamate synthase
VWKKIYPDTIVASEQAIQGALNLARTIGEQNNGMQTLVTGSLHLIGGALNLLRPLK